MQKRGGAGMAFRGGPRTVQKTVRVSVDILEALDTEAKKVGVSVPRIICQILWDWYKTKLANK